MTEKLARWRPVTATTLTLLVLLIGSSLVGCREGPSPPKISLDNVVSFEIGAYRTGSIAPVVDAYNRAKPRSFNTETTPEPLATLHLEGPR